MAKGNLFLEKHRKTNKTKTTTYKTKKIGGEGGGGRGAVTWWSSGGGDRSIRLSRIYIFNPVYTFYQATNQT